MNNIANKVIEKFDNQRIVALVAPARYGKSTYIPLKMYGEVKRLNPKGRVIVVESSETSARHISSFLDSTQTSKIVSYLDNATDLENLTGKIIYMSEERFIMLLLDVLRCKGAFPIASVVILSNAFGAGIYTNLIKYLWYSISLRGYRTPYLLLTSNVEGVSNIIKEKFPIVIVQSKQEPEIIWAVNDSDKQTLVKDIADSIQTLHEHRIIKENREGWLVFVPTKSIADQISILLENVKGLSFSGKKTGQRAIHFVIQEREAEIPQNFEDGVFDSCMVLVGDRLLPATKVMCESRSQYGKFTKRFVTKKTFEEFPASRVSIFSLEQLVMISIYLSDVGADYNSFMLMNETSENMRRRVNAMLIDLGLVDQNGEPTDRGIFVMRLQLNPYSSVMIYELTKKNLEVYFEICVIVAISVCGMSLFNESFVKFSDFSDLHVLTETILDFTKSKLSPNDYAYDTRLKGRFLSMIKSKTSDVMKILKSLNLEIKSDYEQFPTVEELVSNLESVMLEVYKDEILKHNGLNVRGSDRYTGNGGKSYKWSPSFPKKRENTTISESLIPLKVEEYQTAEGVRRCVTLGHPINDMNVGDKYLDQLQSLLDEL